MRDQRSAREVLRDFGKWVQEKQYSGLVQGHEVTVFWQALGLKHQQMQRTLRLLPNHGLSVWSKTVEGECAAVVTL